MKRGQLGYEYVIIIGIFLTLIAPFFYFFFDAMHQQLGNYYGTGAIVTIADLTYTVANLYRGSAAKALVRFPAEATLTARGRELSLSFAGSGSLESVGGGPVKLGNVDVSLSGPRTVTVTNIIDGLMTVSTGGPVIACVTLSNNPPISRSYCEQQDVNAFTMKPSDAPVLIGTQFDSTSVVRMDKYDKQTKQWSEDQVNDNAYTYDAQADQAAASAMVFQEPIFAGKTRYRVWIENSDGSRSNYAYIDVSSGGGQDKD